MGASEIGGFLSWLAVQRRVSASTQNQALSAVLFLYRDVFEKEVGAIGQVPRARVPSRLPVVLSRDEVVPAERPSCSQASKMSKEIGISVRPLAGY